MPFEKIYEFDKYDKIVMTNSVDRCDQQEIVRKLNFPLVSLCKKQRFGIRSIISGIKTLYYTIKSMHLIKNVPHIPREDYIFLYEYFAKFYSIYFSLKFKNIKVLISMNTCHYEFPAILAKAKASGVKTIKILYYINIAKTSDTTRLNAEYCFVTDKLHQEYYKTFPYNKSVKFLGRGGRLTSDYLWEYSKIPKEKHNKKVIMYLSSHTIFADFDEFYVSYFTKFVNENEGFCFILKTHPGDQRDWSYIENENVKVSKVVEGEYFQLVRQTDFVFSVYSTLLFQTKLVNSNSYFLAMFNKEKLDTFGLSFGQKTYSKYIESVETDEFMRKILNGTHKTPSKEFYAQELNPDFGHVAETFKNIVVNDVLTGKI